MNPRVIDYFTVKLMAAEMKGFPLSFLRQIPAESAGFRRKNDYGVRPAETGARCPRNCGDATVVRSRRAPRAIRRVNPGRRR